MTLRRVLLTVLTVGILIALGGFALMWRPAIAPIVANAAVTTDRKAIDQGAELASIGNCSDCHTSTNAAAYAGVRPIPTPNKTNNACILSPDADTGIGSWAEEAF